MYDQHTRGMATTGTGACLRGAEERLLLETKTLHTMKKNVRKPDISNPTNVLST
jgi:hypothetical protein